MNFKNSPNSPKFSSVKVSRYTVIMLYKELKSIPYITLSQPRLKIRLSQCDDNGVTRLPLCSD